VLIVGICGILRGNETLIVRCLTAYSIEDEYWYSAVSNSRGQGRRAKSEARDRLEDFFWVMRCSRGR